MQQQHPSTIHPSIGAEQSRKAISYAKREREIEVERERERERGREREREEEEGRPRRPARIKVISKGSQPKPQARHAP